MENISQKTIDLSNVISAVLHLREASDLLKNEQPELSLLLLKAAKTIMEQTDLVESDVQEVQNLISEISSDNG